MPKESIDFTTAVWKDRRAGILYEEAAAEERGSVIICLMCGTPNETFVNQCIKCGARLPKLDSRTAVVASKKTPKYDLLRTKVLALKTGQLGWADFAEWYQGFYDDVLEKIALHVDGIQQSHGPGWSYYEDFQEEVEMSFAGVQDYETALNQIWQAVDTEDLVLAQQALKIFLRGAEKLIDAAALNLESQRKIEESWGYMY